MMRSGQWFFLRRGGVSRYVVLGLVCVALVSCSGPKDYQRLMKKMTTNDNSFSAGYLDGCDSGRAASGEDAVGTMFFQDVIRYATDKSYARGWDGGYRKCSR